MNLIPPKQAKITINILYARKITFKPNKIALYTLALSYKVLLTHFHQLFSIITQQIYKKGQNLPKIAKIVKILEITQYQILILLQRNKSFPNDGLCLHTCS